SHPDASRGVVQRNAEFVGLEPMRTVHNIVDVRDVPPAHELDLRFRATFWNSLQDDEGRWLGVIGYRGAFKVSMLMLFPAGRPYRERWMTVARAARSAPVPFAGKKLVLADQGRTYLFWEILEPQEGHIYRLHWKW